MNTSYLLAVHSGIQEFSVEKSQGDDMTADRENLVKQGQSLHSAGIEFVRGGHMVVSRVDVAHIVADHGQPQQRGLIQVVVARHRSHLVIRTLDIGSIHTDVLKVVVVAAIAISQLRINRDHSLHSRDGVLVGTLLQLVVSGSPRARRLVELVFGVLQQLIHVPPVGGEPLGRATEKAKSIYYSQ